MVLLEISHLLAQRVQPRDGILDVHRQLGEHGRDAVVELAVLVLAAERHRHQRAHAHAFDRLAACEQQQPPAHLATISDLTDNQAATALAATIPFASSQTNTNQRQRMWLGGNSLATVGVWVWHHGEPFAYANWRVGQPGSPTIERCLILLGSENGVWDDRPCTTSYEAFLCARD